VANPSRPNHRGTCSLVSSYLLLLLIAVASGVLSGIAITAPAIQVLDAGCNWARRCRIPSFVNLYHRIQKHRAAIVAILTRMAYGFTSTGNLIALCLLDRSGHCPALSERSVLSSKRNKVATTSITAQMPASSTGSRTRRYRASHRWSAVSPVGRGASEGRHHALDPYDSRPLRVPTLRRRLARWLPFSLTVGIRVGGT